MQNDGGETIDLVESEVLNHIARVALLLKRGPPQFHNLARMLPLSKVPKECECPSESVFVPFVALSFMLATIPPRNRSWRRRVYWHRRALRMSPVQIGCVWPAF